MNDPAEPIRSIAALLSDIKESFKAKNISLEELILALHERGIAMALLIIALPMALPIPVPPGVNVMLATPLILLTAQQALGSHTIWIPSKMKHKSLSTEKLSHMIDQAVPFMEKIEFFIKPRLGFLTQDGSSRLFGFLGLLMALTVCIPFPLTNTVPSFGIALMSVGFIMRDGLAVLTGALIGMCWISMLTICLLVFGPEAVDIIKDTIKSWL